MVGFVDKGYRAEEGERQPVQKRGKRTTTKTGEFCEIRTYIETQRGLPTDNTSNEKSTNILTISPACKIAVGSPKMPVPIFPLNKCIRVSTFLKKEEYKQTTTD